MKIFRHARKIQPALMLATALAGCTGVIGAPVSRDEGGGGPGDPATTTGSGTTTGSVAGGSGGGPPGDPACAAKPISASPARLRRLSPEEYANTARDLLSAPAALPKLEPPQGQVITELEVETLNAAARDLAALKAHHAFVPCDVNGPPNASCAASFIDDFGEIAFRRPLESDERTWLNGVYTSVTQLATTPPITFREGIDAVAEVILQSPEVVYRNEVGVADATLPPGVRRLSGYERAARLSYLLWSTMPDAALRNAASGGALDTADGVRTQAERLLSDPRAHQMVRRFASTWLELDATPMHPALEALDKNKTKFPYDGAALRAGMRKETESFYEHVFFDKQGSLRALFLSNDAYVNGPLGAMYGAKGGPVAPDAYAWATLDAVQRAGILTRGAFLASEASADYQSPVHRGVFVLRNVLCQDLPPPPPNVDNTPPVPGSSSQLRSVRALLEAKTAGSGCQACHGMINPIGFAFENYDAMGAWQTQEKGTVGNVPFTVDVDAKATIGAADVRGTVNGTVELSALLAESDDARSCAVQKWFEKALARAPAEEDKCLVADLRSRLKQNDDLRQLVVALASSDAALFIKEPTP